MKRLERWILTLLCIQGVFLLIAQLLINSSTIHWAIDPVYKYIGVFDETEDHNYLETIDQYMKNMLPF
ncbi:DUF5359 family protein [Aquibacillus sediminis]|uniref:DUF5359 family protein n=1 Tax=Aquibacillus sediminis TaxID=2574734 RepID=UPI0011089F7A|nr:DUF5359 family protein [Aquibacillus sediminis]